MTCKHEHIQTWRFEDGEVAMWSCVECALKFEPITARADLEAENKRLRGALQLIEHATAPTHDDGAYHENAYELARSALKDEK